MLIAGLPSDLPPTLVLKSDAVYTDDRPDAQAVAGSEEASFYRLYGIWDPRALLDAVKTEDRAPQRGRRWLSYDLRKVVPKLDDTMVNRIVAMTDPADFIREVEYVLDAAGRLVELSQWELDGSANRLNLVFQYRSTDATQNRP